MHCFLHTDYYPFGMLMPNRYGSDMPAGEDYDYGFGGMMKDNEVNGNNNSYTTHFRQYDPRIGRWLSLDPLGGHFPWQSPYVGFDNNPIFYNDPSGAASEGGEPKTHTIKDGDTYWDLAKNNNYSVDDLKRWNKGVDWHDLQIGQVINVSSPDVGYDDESIASVNKKVLDINIKLEKLKTGKTDATRIAEYHLDNHTAVLATDNSVNMDDIKEGAEITVNYLSIAQSWKQSAELSEVNRLNALLKEGRFETVWNGISKNWSLKFPGSGSVPADVVKTSKAKFYTDIANKTSKLRVIKGGGVVLGVFSVGFTIHDYLYNPNYGFSGLGEYGDDAKFVVDLLMIRAGTKWPYGTIVSGFYFLMPSVEVNTIPY